VKFDKVIVIPYGKQVMIDKAVIIKSKVLFCSMDLQLLLFGIWLRRIENKMAR